MANVHIEGVRKSYGGHDVIKGIDLAIEDGQFVALVGPSGCGKSTLLRMVAGLEEISGGEIHIGGRVVNGLAPRDRNVAMVFQNYALYPHLTVAQNMGFSMRLRRADPAVAQSSVERAAEILGIAQLLDRFPGQLSGGQRQRVAMGRAIVRDPAVFLFDEPLSNLDAALRVQMRSEIRALHRRVATTTLYVTHDQIEAMTMADQVVVLRDGLVEQVGSPLELFDRPANTFVAGFIGSPSMNFLKGRIEVPAGGAAVAQLDGDHLLPILGAEALAGREITLGIRPEHLRLDPNGLPGRVTSVEAPGSATHIVIETPAGSVSAVIHDRLRLEVGDEIAIAAAATDIHVFDAATGRRVALATAH